MLNQTVAKSAALLASAALAIAFSAAPAQGATFTYTDLGCSSFSIVGNNLVCNKASCSISASPGTNPSPTTPVSLTETCSPTATAWTWQKVSGDPTCPTASGSANPLNLPAPGVPALNCLYEVDVTLPQVGSAQITINWSNAPPPPPSNCHAAAVPPGPLPIGGGSTTVTVICDSGGAPTSYAWSASPSVTGLVTPTTVNNQLFNITQTTSFLVTPSNAGGNGNVAQVSVPVNQVVQGFCGQYGNTIPAISPVNVTWGQALSVQSSQSGSFGDNTVWLFQMTVPAGTPNSVNPGNFTISEYQGPGTPRQLSISTQACDFRPRDYTGANGPLTVCNDGNTCEISYAVGTGSLFNGTAFLTPGQTYYISARNWSSFPLPNGSASCHQTTCNAIMNEQPAQ